MSEKIVLEWARDHLRVLVAEGDGAHPSLRLVAAKEISVHADAAVSVAEAAAMVRGWLDVERVGQGACDVVIPRESVVVRLLQLPSAPEDDLPDMVRFQAATRTSAPIDSLSLDYLLLPNGESDGMQAVTFTLEASQIKRIHEVLEASGLTVNRVIPSSLTLAQLVRSLVANDAGMSQPDLIVYQFGSRLELAVLDQGTLIFSHSTQLPEASDASHVNPLKSELARSMVALNQAHPDVDIHRCFYLCDTSDALVVSFLEQRFGQNLNQVNSVHLLQGQAAGGFEPLMGAALPATDDRLHIDLLHPRKRKEVPDRRRMYWGAGAGVAVLLCIIAMGIFYSRKSSLNSSIAELNQEIGKIDQRLTGGKPAEEAWQALESWQQTAADPVQLWAELQQHLPGTDRLYFQNLLIAPQPGEAVAIYTGEIHAKTRNDIEVLGQKLYENGFTVKTSSPVQSDTDPDYPFQAQLNVELKRPKPDPASKVASR